MAKKVKTHIIHLGFDDPCDHIYIQLDSVAIGIIIGSLALMLEDPMAPEHTKKACKKMGEMLHQYLKQTDPIFVKQAMSLSRKSKERSR